MGPFNVRALAVLGVAAFALAACGSSSKPSSAPATSPSTAATTTTAASGSSTTVAASGSTTVSVGTTKLGQVLVNDKGMTLYRFDNDTKAGESSCSGQCASTWPPATATGTPAVGTGIDAAKLTTFKRADGTTQLQIDGHPLYMFAGDAKPGDTNGQGIIDKWYAAGPDGDKVGDKS